MAKPPICHGTGEGGGGGNVDDTSRSNQRQFKTKSNKNKSRNSNLAHPQSTQSQTVGTNSVYSVDGGNDDVKRRWPPDDQHVAADSRAGYARFDQDKIRISLNSSNLEIREIKRKLISELDKVRSLKKKIAKNVSFNGCNGENDNCVGSDGDDRVRALARTNSAVSCVGPVVTRPSHSLAGSVDSTVVATEQKDKKKTPGEESSMKLQSDKKLKSSSAGKKDGDKHLESNKKLKSRTVGKRDGEMDAESIKRSKCSDIGKKDGEKNLEAKKLKSSGSGKKDDRNLESHKKLKSNDVGKRDGEMVPESKKSKPSVTGKKDGGKQGPRQVGFTKELHKRCQDLMEKLMKHQYGWVFNEPVDAKRLKLHDYYTIIKHPMDLGTVNSRLSKNWYKSLSEFAEDVRLTFNNAMTYNEKGQDVHAMAHVLLNMFEDKWASIKAKFDFDDGHEGRKGSSSQKPKKDKVPLATSIQPCSSAVAAAPVPSSGDPILADAQACTSAPTALPVPVEAVSTTMPVASNTNPENDAPNKSGSAVLNELEEKDHKRKDMSYEEKQRLSTDLQNLPSEKLERVVDIIRKRNPELFNEDDEIEVDIENFDAETLWELDEFVNEYKKSLSKEYAHHNIEAGHNVQNQVSSLAEGSKELRAGIPVNESGSSGSDSSSSDSGSSQSVSDSDSAS